MGFIIYHRVRRVQSFCRLSKFCPRPLGRRLTSSRAASGSAVEHCKITPVIPRVWEIAVIATPHSRWKEYAMLIVVLTELATKQELREHLMSSYRSDAHRKQSHS
jgi:acyl-CoA synthetase (AMP-forming)/AMP-acid ligase II